MMTMRPGVELRYLASFSMLSEMPTEMAASAMPTEMQ